MVFRRLEHNPDGTEFNIKFIAQGCFECEIRGNFRHYVESPAMSEWEVDHTKAFGTVNGLSHYPVDEILSLLGNGDMDIGSEVLDDMLTPAIEEDYESWLEWMQNEARNADEEEYRNNRFFQKVTGF
jgi:hypothetical protein